MQESVIKKDDWSDIEWLGEKAKGHTYEGRSNACDGEEIERESNADKSHSSQCTLCILSSSTTHTHTMWAVGRCVLILTKVSRFHYLLERR